MTKLKKLLWLLPYLVSGFSAPLIFKHAPTPVVGGHFAGALFTLSMGYALWLAWHFKFSKISKISIVTISAMTVCFWLWRFSITTPLRESFLFGINGAALHGVMTGLYLLGAVVIGVSLARRRSL